jgi:hypothetical protein
LILRTPWHLVGGGVCVVWLTLEPVHPDIITMDLSVPDDVSRSSITWWCHSVSPTSPSWNGPEMGHDIMTGECHPDEELSCHSHGMSSRS